MPIRKTKTGFKIENVPGIHPTRESAEKQLAAIHASKARKTKRGKKK